MKNYIVELSTVEVPVINNTIISSFCSDIHTGSLLTCYANDNTIWVGGSNGQLFKSINGGNTWIDQTRTASIDEYYTSIQYPEDDLVGYMSNTNKYVYKSIDGGTNYNVIYTLDTASYGVIRRTEMFDNVNGILGTSKGYVFYTNDSAVDWIPTTLDVNGYSWSELDSILCIEYVNASIIHIGCDYGKILRSTDGGETFKIIMPDATYANQLYGISFLDANTGIATARDGYYYLTFDGCVTWEKWVSAERIGLNVFRYVKWIDKYNLLGFQANGLVLRSTNVGRHFVSEFDSSTSFNRAAVISKDKFFACGLDSTYSPVRGTFDCNINYTPNLSTNFTDITDYITELGSISKTSESDIISETAISNVESMNISLAYIESIKTFIDNINDINYYKIRIKYYDNVVYEGIIDTSTITIDRFNHTVSFDIIDKISALDMIQLPVQRSVISFNSCSVSSPITGSNYFTIAKGAEGEETYSYRIYIRPYYYSGSAWYFDKNILSQQNDVNKLINGSTYTFSSESIDKSVFVKYGMFGVSEYCICQSEDDWFTPSAYVPNVDLPASATETTNITNTFNIYEPAYYMNDININYTEFYAKSAPDDLYRKLIISRSVDLFTMNQFLLVDRNNNTWNTLSGSSILTNGCYITMPISNSGYTYSKGIVTNLQYTESLGTYNFNLTNVYGIAPYTASNYPIDSQVKTVLVEQTSSIVSYDISGTTVNYNRGVKSFDWTKIIYNIINNTYPEIDKLDIGTLDRVFDLNYYDEMYKDTAPIGKAPLDMIKFLLDANMCYMYIVNDTIYIRRRNVKDVYTPKIIDDSINNSYLLSRTDNRFWDKIIDGVNATIESRIADIHGDYVTTEVSKTKYLVDTIEPKNSKDITIPYTDFFVGSPGSVTDIKTQLTIYGNKKIDELLEFYGSRHTTSDIVLVTDSTTNWDYTINDIISFTSEPTIYYFIESINHNIIENTINLKLVSVNSYIYINRNGINKPLI